MYLFNRILFRVVEKINQIKFMRLWKSCNKHNSVMPVSMFDVERVRVGAYSYGALHIFAYNKESNSNVYIGNYVSIASGVKFFLDEQHAADTFTSFPLRSILLNDFCFEDAMSKGSITVNDEVWIGADSIIMSGVSVGKGAIIAAGSVVTKDVTPYSIVGGVPARLIKMRFDSSTIKELMDLRLIDIPVNKIKENIDLFYTKLSPEVIKKIRILNE